MIKKISMLTNANDRKKCATQCYELFYLYPKFVEFDQKFIFLRNTLIETYVQYTK
jgi:hypothetical protein